MDSLSRWDLARYPFPQDFRRVGHDAEEVEVVESAKVAQALMARHHVDSVLKLVLLDLLLRVPTNEREVEWPIVTQLLELHAK